MIRPRLLIRLLLLLAGTAAVAAEEGEAEPPQAEADPAGHPDDPAKALRTCPECALHGAAHAGDLEQVKLVLDHFGGRSASDDGNGLVDRGAPADGTTALFYAAQAGHAHVVDHLLNMRGADPNAAPRSSGATPLYVAVQEGHFEVVETLLHDPRTAALTPTSEGVTPLMSAAHAPRARVLEALLVHSSAVRRAVNLRSPRTGHTALHVSAIKGHAENVEALIEHSAGFLDPNTQVHGSKATPLMYAAAQGHLAVVRALLQHDGIDVTPRDAQHWTPALAACRAGHGEVLAELLAYMGPPGSERRVAMVNHAAERGGTTCLMAATHTGKWKVVEQLLAEPGVDANAQEEKGWTALMIAAESGHLRAAQALLRHAGLDVRAVRPNMWSALHDAATGGRTEIVRDILAHDGTDTALLEALGTDGHSAFTAAAFRGHHAVLRAFCRDGRVNPNHPAGGGMNARNALHIASQEGHLEAVETLVLRCAPQINVAQLTSDEQTALEIAQQNAHPKVVAFLEPRMPVADAYTQGAPPKAPEGMGALVGAAAAQVAAAAAAAAAGGGEL